MAKLIDPISKTALLTLRIYQYCISPWFGECCRFYPSCSQYTAQAIHKHGLFYGCYLMMRRLIRCHPWHQGGFDPVPEKIHYVNKYD